MRITYMFILFILMARPTKSPAIVIAAAVVLLSACATDLTDQTQGVQNSPNSQFFLSVDVQPQIMAIVGSIEAYAVIDGVSHIMNGSGAGPWSYTHDAGCVDSFAYKFEVTNTFPAPPFPIYTNTATSRLPEQGNATVQIDPVTVPAPQFNPTDILSIICSAGSDSCTRPVRIINSGVCPLTIQPPQVLGNPCGDACPIGQNNGSGFSVVNEDAFPYMLGSNESVDILIRASRASSYTIYNAQLQIMSESEYSSSRTKVIALTSQVFFFP